MDETSFFAVFKRGISKIIDEKFPLNAELTVKKIRKIAGIPSKDRSKIVFLSRVLSELAEEGYLQFIGRNSPKRYRVVRRIG